MLLLCAQITEPYLIICLRNPCSQKPGDRNSRGNSGNSNRALPATKRQLRVTQIKRHDERPGCEEKLRHSLRPSLRLILTFSVFEACDA
jgi:hypothetical protein